MSYDGRVTPTGSLSVKIKRYPWYKRIWDYIVRSRRKVK